MTETTSIVYVVDDDDSVRKGLGRMLRFAGFSIQTFASAEEFLLHDRTNSPGCLILDVQMPGLDGLGLQRALNDSDIPLPVIFITGHGDIPMSVRAMRAGALDFLPKPFSKDDLLAAVRRGLEKAAHDRGGRDEVAAIRQRVAGLTLREREVLTLVVRGMLNKQVGHRLRVTEKTVKFHRGNVMQKMKADSLADLVRMAEKGGIGGPTN
jgi:FixJ family two-component response regulator